MKRYVIAALAVGLWSVQAWANEPGMLAPTAPVVPAPVIQDGKLIAPSTGLGSARGMRLLSAPRGWSPRDSTEATTRISEPVAPTVTMPPPVTFPPYHGYATSPSPNGACAPDANCAPGCGRGARGGVNWDRLKAWLCYHPSKTELPKCRPTPYVGPLLGMFPCSSWCPPGCANGGNGYAPGTPQIPPPQMPEPIPPGVGARGVVMPPRGTQGPAVLPTWQGRTPSPAAASAGTGISGSRFAFPEVKPVVNAGYKAPAPKK